MRMSALAEYLKQTGISQADFGARLDAPVSQSAVSQWIAKKVPAERVLEVERASGGALSRHELRPDLYPREQVAA